MEQAIEALEDRGLAHRKDGRRDGGARWGWAWLLAALALLGFGLGSYPLIDPDEGESALVALAMVRTGDPLVPHLNGLPFLDKPFLFYALQALAMRLAGIGELAARLPSLLAAWATVGVTAGFARRLWGAPAAWVAGLAAATMPMVIAMARTARSDALLALFLTVALVAFHGAVEKDRRGDGGGRSPWGKVAWLAMGAGILTKGPVALLVPLLVVVPYSLWRRRPGAVWDPWGVGLLLLVVAPWVALMEWRVPGFLHYALVTESVQRVATDELRRAGPVWYFLPYLVAGAFPWLWMVLGSMRWRRGGPRRLDPRLVYLATWLLVPLLFFSLSQSKRPHYILPLLPAVALLAAWSWQSGARWRGRGVAVGAVAWGLLGGLLLAVAFVADLRQLDPGLREPATGFALAAGLVALAASALAAWGRRRDVLGPVALSLPLVLLPVLSASLVGAIADGRSGRALAGELNPHLGPGTTVVGIETFSRTLSFYLRRPIRLSTATADALGSNYLRRHVDELSSPDSPYLCPPGCWQEALRAREDTVFLLKPHYRNEIALLESAGLSRLAADEEDLVMGSCGPEGDPL